MLHSLKSEQIDYPNEIRPHLSTFLQGFFSQINYVPEALLGPVGRNFIIIYIRRGSQFMENLMVGFFYRSNPFVHNLQTLVLILIALDPVCNMLTNYC